jgi:hypothetical protein
MDCKCGATFSAPSKKIRRLARVAEFFAYVASARKLYHSRVLSGRIQAFFDLA